jgi:hypothetical protein
MSRTLKLGVQRVSLKVNRDKVYIPERLRQFGNAATLLFLCCWMVDLEDLYAGKFRHSPGAPVVASPEVHELSDTGCDRLAERSVDRRRPKCQHICHRSGRFHLHAAPAVSHGIFDLCKASLSSLVKENTSGRIAKVGNVRQTDIRKGSGKGN